MKHHCPICRKPTDSESDADFPFCSERCRLLDLGNWAAEKYKISAPAHDESESDESATHSRESQESETHHDDRHAQRNKN